MHHATRQRAAALLLPLLAATSPVQAAPVLESMNLLTMMEATTAAINTLADYSSLNPLGQTNGTAQLGAAGLHWSGSYDAAGWSWSVSGELGGVALSLSYSGFLSGADGQDVTVAFTGTGTLGIQPILMTGNTLWSFDALADDYLVMDFEQEAQIEAASRYNWTTGRERVKCLGDGIVTDLITGQPILVGIASSGKKSDVASGLRHCVKDLSQVTRHGSLTVSLITYTQLTAQRQAKPAAPALPPEGDLFNPSHQGSLFTEDGRLFADDPSNRFRSEGTAGIRGSGGTLEGDIFAVPAPATLSLLALALVMGLRPHHLKTRVATAWRNAGRRQPS